MAVEFVRAADTVRFDVLPPGLRRDVRRALASGIEAGAVFGCTATPLEIFRHAIREALSVDEARLGFLLRGVGPDGSTDAVREASVERYASAVRLGVSRVVAALQGALAELLAVSACCELLQDLQSAGRVPAPARMYFGDVVLVPRRDRSIAKAADLHILVHEPDSVEVEVFGVGEVKSYFCSRPRLRRQVENHVARLRNGSLCLTEGPERCREMDAVKVAGAPVAITVVPSSWHLPRVCEIRRSGGTSRLEAPLRRADSCPRIDGQGAEWNITLGWSHEALAAAAFEILHWYLGHLGTVLYSSPNVSPWPDLDPEEAGRQAAVMMLYYALLQRPNPRVERQLIKLYNVLGFGYSLGAHFVGPDGKLRMLWAADLDEISSHGHSSDGARILA